MKRLLLIYGSILLVAVSVMVLRKQNHRATDASIGASSQGVGASADEKEVTAEGDPLDQDFLPSQFEDRHIRLAMPVRFWNPGFDAFVEKLSGSMVTVSVQLFDSWSSYRSFIQSGWKSSADIVLVPLDWMNGQTIASLDTRELRPYLDENWIEVMDNFSGTLIPFAFDPLVSFVSVALNIPSSSFVDLLGFLYTYRASHVSKIPLLWGLDKEEISGLKQSKESFPNQLLVWNTIFDLFASQQNIQLRDAFKKFVGFDAGFVWNLKTFKLLYAKLNQKNSYCNKYPDICVFAYGFSDLKFGFMSDRLIYQKFFSQGTRELERINVVEFPVIDRNRIPMRGWGFAVRPGMQKALAQLFLDQYVIAGLRDKLSFWNGIGSPFTSVLDFQVRDPLYAKFFGESENIFLLTGSSLKINLENELAKELMK